MKILGIGVDIVDNSRIDRSLKNNSFIKRVFSKSEILSKKKKKIKNLIIQKDLQPKKLFQNQLAQVLETTLILKIYLLLTIN